MHTWLPVLLSKTLSLIQATTLRERYYTLEQRVEILSVAIDDIQRINARSSQPDPLIERICAQSKEKPYE